MLTFLLSIDGNFFGRALLHSVYSFAIIFAVAFALRWFLGTLVGLKPLVASSEEAPDEVGGAVNVSTPDDQEQLNELLKQQLTPDSAPEPAGTFVPLAPKKLASVTDADAEQLAQALRQLKEK